MKQCPKKRQEAKHENKMPAKRKRKKRKEKERDSKKKKKKKLNKRRANM